MIKTLSLNFALKKTKVNAEGLAPVYMRFTIDGHRIEFSIQRFIRPEFWSTAGQKMKGSYEEARVFNQFLRAMEQRTYDAHRQLLEMRQEITVHTLKDKLFGTEVKVDVSEICYTLFRGKLTTCFAGKELQRML